MESKLEKACVHSIWLSLKDFNMKDEGAGVMW